MNLLIRPNISRIFDLAKVSPNKVSISFFFLFFQGGLILVSHNEHLFQMVAKETWLCGEITVKTIEGGFPAYKKALEEEFRRINAI